MTLSNQELELEVNAAILKMATAKYPTFWRAFAEILYNRAAGYDHFIYSRIIAESHLRLEEFEKAWQVNLYNRRILK